MRKVLITLLFLVLSMSFLGCSLFPKEINLRKCENVLSPVKDLEEKTLSLVVRDERETEPGLIGDGGLSFVSVTTNDDIPGWVETTIKEDLEKAGCRLEAFADPVLIVTIRKVFASLYPFVLSSAVDMNARVENRGEVLLDMDYAAGTCPLGLFYSTSLYRDGLADAMTEWKRECLPQVLDKIALFFNEVPAPGPKPEPKAKPLVKLVHPTGSEILRDSECDVSFEVKPGNAFSSISLLVNKRTVMSAPRLLSPCKVRLIPGINEVIIQGFTKDNQVVEDVLKLKYQPYSPVNKRVFIVGISSFDNIPGNFKGEAKAGSMVSSLQKNFPEKDRSAFTLVLGKQAENKALFKETSKCLTATEESQYAVIYYSGKTIVAGKELALAAVDTDPARAVTAMSLKDLVILMKQSFKGAGVLLIIEPSVKGEKTEAELVKKAVVQDERLSVLCLGGNSNLAEAVTGESDANRDGHVSVSELLHYMEKKRIRANLYGDINRDYILR